MTPGCIRWDAPDPSEEESLLPQGQPASNTQVSFILWHAELSTESSLVEAAGNARSVAEAVQQRTRRRVLLPETRRLLALSAYRLVLNRRGRIRRAGVVRLLVEPAADAASDEAFRQRWNVSRAVLADKALPLRVVLRRFVRFVSRDRGAGGDARARAHVFKGQLSPTPALRRSEPAAWPRGTRAHFFSGQTETSPPCLPMLRWGNQIDLLETCDGGGPQQSGSDAMRVLRWLGACTRDVRPVLEAAPLNLSGWDEEHVHTHPGVGLTPPLLRLRRSPCEPSFLALRRLALRSAGTGAALRAVVGMPSPASTPDASLRSSLEGERPIPFWVRNTDVMHATAVGGATPAVQVSWPRPF
jgi:hypothetical protein